MIEWISVKDRLPNRGDVVLLCSVNSVVQCVAYYKCQIGDNEYCWQDWLECSDPVGSSMISHWMPLPEPPKDA